LQAARRAEIAHPGNQAGSGSTDIQEGSQQTGPVRIVPGSKVLQPQQTGRQTGLSQHLAQLLKQGGCPYGHRVMG